jgi:hypothetical protein
MNGYGKGLCEKGGKYVRWHRWGWGCAVEVLHGWVGVVVRCTGGSVWWFVARVGRCGSLHGWVGVVRCTGG